MCFSSAVIIVICSILQTETLHVFLFISCLYHVLTDYTAVAYSQQTIGDRLTLIYVSTVNEVAL